MHDDGKKGFNEVLWKIIQRWLTINNSYYALSKWHLNLCVTPFTVFNLFREKLNFPAFPPRRKLEESLLTLLVYKQRD